MKTKVFFFSVLFLFFSSKVFSQFTKQQAIDTVLNHIVVLDTGQVNVFIADTTYSLTDTLLLENFEKITFTFSENWVFFVDDLPLTHWSHPCRYIAVNAESGEHEIIQQSIFPVDLTTDFDLINHLNFEPFNNSNPLVGASAAKSPKSVEPNPNLYAVLIHGSNDTKEFWNDISNIYCTLIEAYGYEKENIFVHYFNKETNTQKGKDLDGDDIYDDIDYSSHLDTLKRTFLNLGGVAGPLYDPSIPELDEDDQLFVFVNGHGFTYSIPNNDGTYLQIKGTSSWDNRLYDTTLANWLQHINCAQMILTMEQCISGGFIDDITDYVNYQVQCSNREIHTACEYESSFPEMWVTLGDDPPTMDNFKFGEFVFYWTAAARGYYPDFEEPWNVWEDFPVGTFPLEDLFPEDMDPPHPGDHDPDLNGDGIIQIGEAFAYADFFDAWSPNGFYAPHPAQADPNTEHPDKEKIIGFQEDLLSLYGLSGEIANTQTVQGNFAIGGPLSLTHNATLTLSPNTNLYFINDYVEIDGMDVDIKFTVPAGTALVLENDVSIYGYDDPNSIDIYGDIQFGLNNRFLSLSGSTWEGINLLNEEANISIEGAIFEKCGISGNPEYIDMDDMDFSNGFIDLETTNVDLDNSEFYHSNFKNIYGDRTSFVNINNCNFDHSWTNGIYIDTYFSYQIKYCTINNCMNGINIYNSGSSKTASIFQNQINNNYDDGVLVYNSHAYLTLNNVRDNYDDGISLHNNSYIKLKGNDGAHLVSETQRFRDNGLYEVFSDEGSFPELFKWNAIIDEDNEADGYELVYCETNSSNVKDVRINYWGSKESFHPENDLFPVEDYNYLPKFELEDDEDNAGTAESMFNTAEINFEQGAYTIAKSEFKQIIEQYPDNKFAKASIKQLFSIEEYESNDYSSLQQYYKTNNIILNNPELKKLAEFFANKCDIKLENWQDAINWFEDEIQDPDSYADSLYAIIDLGNTYLLMEQSGYKSAYSGSMIKHIPTSKDQYAEKRDFLISLLPNDKLDRSLQNNLGNLSSGELLQNFPNPFNGSTQIWYKLENESTVTLNVYNYTGQLVKSIEEGTKSGGNHFVEFDASGLKNGIYFYSISINGQVSDSKKMTLLK